MVKERFLESKIYRMYGINSAIEMLRPGAKWEASGTQITRWDDPRPCPSWDEVQETMEKVKKFEESINTIWLPEQFEQLTGQFKTIVKYNA